MPARWLRGWSLLVAAVVLMTACAVDGGRADWRDLSVEVPDGWVVAERDDRRLSIANADFGPGQADELEAAVFLTHEPGASIDRWRDLAREEEEGEIVTDDTITVGGRPAHRLVFDHDANGTPLREMVVIVPTRDVVMLFQPVVHRGSAEGANTFERYRDTFEQVLATVRFDGAGDGGGGSEVASARRSTISMPTSSVLGPRPLAWFGDNGEIGGSGGVA